MGSRHLISLLVLCIGFYSAHAQCDWEFDLSIMVQNGATYPPPMSPLCGLYFSDNVRFVNSGSMSYNLVRLSSPQGFNTCDVSLGNVVPSIGGLVTVPANDGVQITLSNSQSGRWMFQLGDVVYLVTNGSSQCLTAVFTVLSDLSRDCTNNIVLTTNGRCTIISSTRQPPTSTSMSSPTSFPSTISPTISPSSTPMPTPPPVPPADPGVNGGGTRLTIADYVLIALIIIMVFLVGGAVGVLVFLISIFLRRRRGKWDTQANAEYLKMGQRSK